MEIKDLRNKNIDKVCREIIEGFDNTIDMATDRIIFLQQKDYELDYFVIEELKALKHRVIREAVIMKARVNERILLNSKTLLNKKEQEGNVVYLNFAAKE